MKAFVLAGALVLTACGDASEPAATAPAAPLSAGADVPVGCELPPLTLEFRPDGDGARQDLEVVDATAVRRSGGRAFTVYLTDFRIDREASFFEQLGEPPDGSTMVLTGLDVFAAEDPAALPVLEPGVVGHVDWTSGEPATFLTIGAGGDSEGVSLEPSGTTVLLHVDERFVCMRSEITSASGTELVGTYTAEIVTDF